MVSVVIPSYNCAAFLASTIDSVLSQTFNDLEVIVIDDGSTDDTLDVLSSYGERIRLIVQPNRGLPAARNAGIRAALGEFIALLDADDSWTQDKLTKQMPRFVDPEVGIVASDFSVLYSDGRLKASYLAERPLADEGYVFNKYIHSRFLFPSTMVLRRACFDQSGLFDEAMLACEDIELFARICLRWKVALLREPLMKRYEGTHNITANQKRLSHYTIVALTKVLSKESDLSEAQRLVVQEELGRQYFWRGYADFHAGIMTEARRCLGHSVKADLSNLRKAAPLIMASMLPRWALKRLVAKRFHRA